MISAFRSVSWISCIAFALLAGCSNMKYTVHIDSSLEGKKITASTIAVFPVQDMRYAPPSTCMGPQGSPGDQITFEANWNGKLRSSLVAKFPAQKWVFVGDGQAEGVDVGAVIDLSGKAVRATTISEMESDRIWYEELGQNSQMQNYLQNLQSATGAQYAMVFADPVLSGEIVTSYYASPNGGGMSSTTYYTGDIKVLVWECSTGRLLFSSGGWSKKSSPCIFIPPQDVAIDGVNSKFQRNLAKVIALLMQYDAGKQLTFAR